MASLKKKVIDFSEINISDIIWLEIFIPVFSVVDINILLH